MTWFSRRVSALACSVAGVIFVGGIASAQGLPELRGANSARPATSTPAIFDDLPEPTGSTLVQPKKATSAATAPEDDPTPAVERAGSVDSLDDERSTRAQRDNIRTGAIEGRGRTADDNPYLPLGLRAGSFLVMPTLEQGLSWTSNATSSPNGSNALLSETALRLNAVSDWARHSMTVQADGIFRKSISGEAVEEIEGGARGDLRLDLGGGFEAQAGLGYRARPESASSPVTIGNVASQPLRQTLTGMAGISRDAGRLRVGLTGNVSRDVYDDARLVDGSTFSQRDRNATLATVALRAGYEISPALRPFIEAEIGRRLQDEKIDFEGYARSADRYGLRAGLELDMGEKLRGEFSAGWLTERPDDARLAAISAPTLAASLLWSPLRGTMVELNGSTTVESTTRSGASGSLLYSGSLAISREVRANLTGRALIGLDWRDYSGSGDSDTILRGEASLTWWMNRNAGITARARHEIQRSSLADRDYDATSLYLGMTLQR